MDYQPTESDLNLAVLEYQAAVATVARSTAPVANRCDAIAFTRDDYLQELALVAVHSRQRFRDEHGFNVTHERRYVLKSLWNYVRSMMRNRVKAGSEYLTNVAEAKGQHEMMGGTANPVPQLEAREYLREIAASLRADEMELVERLAAAGGHVPRAYEGGDDGTVATFRRHVYKLRERVRDLRR